LPRGRGHLADQLTRAALSIVNNLAEGAGKFSKGDKRRYYLAAIGSSTESAAMLDGCLRRKLITDDAHQRGKQLLERVVSMLIKLSKALDDR
jgi:four helix bundle protein